VLRFYPRSDWRDVGAPTNGQPHSNGNSQRGLFPLEDGIHGPRPHSRKCLSQSTPLHQFQDKARGFAASEETKSSVRWLNHRLGELRGNIARLGPRQPRNAKKAGVSSFQWPVIGKALCEEAARLPCPDEPIEVRHLASIVER
jgi:hypothetical protein